MGRIGGHVPIEVIPCTSPAAPRFNGVRMRPDWRVWVTETWDPITKKRIWLGSYRTAEMAARAYDAAVVCLKGPNHPMLNFPDALIFPDQVWPCTNHKYIKDIAKAAAYAAMPSSLSASHAATHKSLMVDTIFKETRSSSQVARLSHGRSHSGYTHDQTPLVTHPDVHVPAKLQECSIGRPGYPIEEDLIYSHDDLILFDYIEPGEEDVKSIAKAAAYAAIPSSIPAAHGDSHKSLPMVDTRPEETRSLSQVARPSNGRSQSGYLHDQTPLVTHPGVYVPAKLRECSESAYPIEEDLIYSHDNLILFDYIEPGEESDYSGYQKSSDSNVGK